MRLARRHVLQFLSAVLFVPKTSTRGSTSGNWRGAAPNPATAYFDGVTGRSCPDLGAVVEEPSATPTAGII